MRKYSDQVASFFQFLAYVALAMPIRLFFRANKFIYGDINHLQKGSLVVANHQSILDPFIILAYLPFRVFVRILPLRIPVCERYIRIPIMSKALKLLGCYNIGGSKKQRMLALFYTRHLLRNNKTVFLFPEGKVCKEGRISDFQKGIEFFVSASKSVIFIKMDGFNRVNLRTLIKSNRILKFSKVHKVGDKIKKTTSKELKIYLESL